LQNLLTFPLVINKWQRWNQKQTTDRTCASDKNWSTINYQTQNSM